MPKIAHIKITGRDVAPGTAGTAAAVPEFLPPRRFYSKTRRLNPSY